MQVVNKIPFVNEKASLNKTIKIINLKKLGVAIIRNSKKETIGIFTDYNRQITRDA